MLPLLRGVSGESLAAILRLRSLPTDLFVAVQHVGAAAAISCTPATAFTTSAAQDLACIASPSPSRQFQPQSRSSLYPQASRHLHTWCSNQPNHQSACSTSSSSSSSSSSQASCLPPMALGRRSMATAAAAQPAAEEERSLPSQPPAASAPNPDDWRELHGMHVEDVTGQAPPDPVHTFEEAGFPPQLLQVVLKAGYQKPTPIQSQAWPIANADRDLIAIASTGSGKTAGFLVPALAHIRKAATRLAEARSNSKGQAKLGAVALVLAPTRELARQIQAEAVKFGASLGLRTACLFGGASRGSQHRELMRHPHMIIATPGRLTDFAESGELDLSRISYLVLDEADRMLDMGFEPQLRKIMTYVPRDRQTLFFSATWPKEVQKVAESFAARRPVRLFVGDVSSKPVAATTITQLVKVLDSNDEKADVLIQYLQSKPKGEKALVFVAKKSRCSWLQHLLSPAANTDRRLALRVAILNGDMTQQARDLSIENFKTGRMQLLVATDVAARGLDISDVKAVVNFDAPNDIESYIHRIGRTGRAGQQGEALTLLTRDDAGLAPHIVKVMQEVGQVPPAELEELAASSRGYGSQQRRSYGGGQAYGGRGGYGRDRPAHSRHNDRRDRGSSRYADDDGSYGSPGRTRMSGEFGGRSHRHDGRY